MGSLHKPSANKPTIDLKPTSTPIRKFEKQPLHDDGPSNQNDLEKPMIQKEVAEIVAKAQSIGTFKKKTEIPKKPPEMD